MDLTISDTRKIHLNQMQLLDQPKKISPVDLVKKIGFVQIDSIFVIARSHDLTFHTRSSNYVEEQIWKHIETGELFEEFAHAKSFLYRDEFPFYYGKMLDRRKLKWDYLSKQKNFKKIVKDTLKLFDEINELTINDVPIPDSDNKSDWSSYRKNILDYLALCGYIAVKKRDNFSKIIFTKIEDKHEIPDKKDIPNRLDVFWYQLNQSMKVLGLSPKHRILHYKYIHRNFEYNGQKYSPNKLFNEAVKSKEICEIKIEKEKYYYLPEFEDDLSNIPNLGNQVHLLNPFDNALWSREALLKQYNFDYKIQIYTPKEKRLYGYFALPILFGENFVGRVDVKLDRKSSRLNFLEWFWENGFKPNKVFWDELTFTMKRFNEFHKSDKIHLGKISKKHQNELIHRLDGIIDSKN
jgi:uncharacterized protein